LTVDSDSKILHFLEGKITRDMIRLWTENLRGFQPLKRGEMLRKYRNRLVILKELNDFVENVSVELKISRDRVREGIKKLQEKQGLRANYNQVKDAALKQLIKYSMQEARELHQDDSAVATPKNEELMREAGCKVIHELLEPLPLHDFGTRTRWLPRNGIYFFYEEGEICSHSGIQRIVRIGTHGAKRTLKRRLVDHYDGNREGSIFRKHLGTALLQRSGASNDQIKGWIRRRKGYELWKTFDEIEREVDEVIKKNFFFRVILVDNAQERKFFEKRLIATISACPICSPSMDWLGNYAWSEKVKKSGLWNSNHVFSSEVFTEKQLTRFEELVKRTQSKKLKKGV